MSNHLHRERVSRPPFSGESGPRENAASPLLSDYRLRVCRWLSGLLAAMLWVTLVYGMPLQSLRAARYRARVELSQLLQTEKPDTASIIDAFDQATGDILFAASGPYLILAVAAVFLTAHLVDAKRRLNAAERDIRTLRNTLLEVERIPREKTPFFYGT